MSGWNGFLKGCWWCCTVGVLWCGLLFSGGCGCRKKPEVYTYRANDPAYFEELMQERQKQVKAERAWWETSMQMTQLVELVREAYPQGLDEDALLEVLAANEEWTRLAALEQEQKEFAQKVRDGSYALVQARMMEEQQALAAVKAGKAKALDSPREMIVRTPEALRKKE
ncbi:MAG: hypothetical protein FWH21_00950 [Kiritimatiellaeota bacterium]|nr:hypothetical protein [Kiritimatiellota bacterium]